MGVSTIKMPQLGESVTEGTVDRWLKKEGDFVKRDEPLVEVVTDKVNAENRTRDGGFADLCLTTWLRRRPRKPILESCHQRRTPSGRRWLDFRPGWSP